MDIESDTELYGVQRVADLMRTWLNVNCTPETGRLTTCTFGRTDINFLAPRFFLQWLKSYSCQETIVLQNMRRGDDVLSGAHAGRA